MNLLLLDAAEVDADGHARLTGRRAEHLRRVLGVEPGDEVRVGIIGGRRGRAKVLAAHEGNDGGQVAVDLTVELAVDVPPGRAKVSPIHLVVGLPRPQALKRVLEYAATFGVGRLDLIKAWRVEKSYFHTPVLEPQRLRHHLLLGAEQGLQTALPEVSLHPRFVPFVEGLGEPVADASRLVAHPDAERSIEELGESLVSSDAARKVTIAIGPEGGFIDREIDTLTRAGFSPVRLGPWILRVETALVAVLAQLDLLRRAARVAMK